MWAALLTGGAEAQGRGTIGDDVRDATSRVPILWFQDTEPHETPRQRFHLDVQVPYDVAEQRIAAAVAAGAVIVDDSRAPYHRHRRPGRQQGLRGHLQPATRRSRLGPCIRPDACRDRPSRAVVGPGQAY